MQRSDFLTNTVTASIAPDARIGDNARIESTLNIPEDLDLSRVTLNVDLPHTFRGDLVVTLTSPSGKTAVISNRAGGSADDLRGPFDLGSFAGETTLGDWKLTVEDKAKGDVGTLKSWGLELTGLPRTPPPPPPPKTEPSPPVGQVTVLGRGDVKDRYTAEVHGREGVVYTSTWGTRGGNRGNTINIFDTSGDSPVLKGSVTIAGARTIGDLQVSDDGNTLVATSEGSPAAITTYDISDPLRPRQLAQFSGRDLQPDVHTGDVQRIDGKLYVFASVTSSPAKLVVVDITDPAAPKQVLSRPTGRPYLHDVFVKDGLLYTAGWDEGTTIWDIGGADKGGTVENPVKLSTFKNVGGASHNLAVYDDPVTKKRYAVVGEEQPGDLGRSSRGDVHVVDITNPTQPKEIAFLNIPGAGVHNFALDEEKGILYAAYYNAGVVALDLRGDIADAPASTKGPDGRVQLDKAGRVIARPLSDQGQVFIWGVHKIGDTLYASDMLNGVWKLDVSKIRS